MLNIIDNRSTLQLAHNPGWHDDAGEHDYCFESTCPQFGYRYSVRLNGDEKPVITLDGASPRFGITYADLLSLSTQTMLLRRWLEDCAAVTTYITTQYHSRERDRAYAEFAKA